MAYSLYDIKPIVDIQPSEYRRSIYFEQFKSEYSSGWFTQFRTSRQSIAIISFISYLGTNGGFSFLQEAESIYNKSKFNSRSDAYLFAWVCHNKRVRGINFEYKAIEYILSPLDKRSSHYGLLNFNPDSIPISVYESVEAAVIWLGTPLGQRYLLKCEQEIINVQAERYAKAMVDFT